MNIAELEAARIDNLASQYRSKGYEVYIHPDRSRVPDFMFGFVPDMIALSAADNVIVQVTSAREFDPEQTQKLAEFIQNQKDWRFEVALVNLPTAPDVPAEEDLAADEQVARLIENAELLSNQSQPEASALLAWSAVEAILRKRARTAAPELERQSSARVLKHLYSLGRIQPDVYDTLSRLMEFRNAVAHGFAPRAAAPNIPKVITDIRRLQAAA